MRWPQAGYTRDMWLQLGLCGMHLRLLLLLPAHPRGRQALEHDRGERQRPVAGWNRGHGQLGFSLGLRLRLRLRFEGHQGLQLRPWRCRRAARWSLVAAAFTAASAACTAAYALWSRQATCSNVAAASSSAPLVLVSVWKKLGKWTHEPGAERSVGLPAGSCRAAGQGTPVTLMGLLCAGGARSVCFCGRHWRDLCRTRVKAGQRPT